MSLDILICIMPLVQPDAPTAGAGVLKAHLLEAGFTAEVLDLNIRLYRYLETKGTHHDYYYGNDVLFSNQPSDPINEEYEEFYSIHSDVFSQWIEIIREKNPKWLGMSLMSAFSVATAMKLSELIRQHLPNLKIVWGGTNVQHNGFFDPVHKGLIDYFIKGDAERSLIELLKGNTTYKGINNIEVFDEVIPFDISLPPNYDDIKWDEYEQIFFSKPAYITASRGCVRRCTFCNDYKIWPTYRFKTAKNIAEQIDIIKRKYGRNTFLFTDSLVNGSIKNFREMLVELKNIKEKYHPQIFRWSSHMIVRPKNQMPEEDFSLMSQSGCIEAVIGVESFSESVRYHMGKKFTNEDIWYTFEMLDKYKIRNQILMLVGYATETEEDHQENLRSIDKVYELGYGHTKDPRNGEPLVRWTFGNSLLLNEKHNLFDMIKDDPTWEWHSAMDWKYKDNDMATRLRRWKESIAQVQKHDPSYQPAPVTARTIEITEERLNNPNGPRFWSE
jgi:anaerobic magnesium-protoporphyrin IX monomethyl ester cyclase